MTWQSLLDTEIQKFILAHEKDDVSALALKKSPNANWNYPLILEQIKARQKAAQKIPLWAGHHPDIVFPSSSILEQASSAATARYKAGLVKGKSFVDLTAGAGVDVCAFTEHFERGVCVDMDENASALAGHNLKLLSDKEVKAVCSSAEEYVKDMNAVSLVYLDPQRRDSGRKGKYKLEDCSPNIFELLPVLLEKAEFVMLKTSPMLDIWTSVQALEYVREVHVVEWRGECKEVVYILGGGDKLAAEDIPVTAVRLNDMGEVLQRVCFTKAQEQISECGFSAPLKYLYEPSPAFQKAGCFKSISKVYGVEKLHPSTHLYTANHVVDDFPGRTFKVLGIYSPKAQKMPVKKANLSVRNFPQGAEILKKKLKLKDGGDDYLFACTLFDECKAIIHSHKYKI